VSNNVIRFPGFILLDDRNTILKDGKRYNSMKALIDDLPYQDLKLTYQWRIRQRLKLEASKIPRQRISMQQASLTIELGRCAMRSLDRPKPTVPIVAGKVVLHDTTEEPNTHETNMGAGGGHLSSFDERESGFGCTKGNRRLLFRAVAACRVAIAARCVGSVHG
jgi:hypothetical protein